MDRYAQLMARSSKPSEINGYCSERVAIHSLFTADECQRILNVFDTWEPENAVVGKPQINRNDTAASLIQDTHLRKLTVTNADNEHPELLPYLSRLEEYMEQVNRQYWNLELTDFSQPARLMTYQVTDHFNSFHADHGPGKTCFRKLTAIVQLSDSSQYAGGEFELPGEIFCERIKDIGTTIVFPAYLIHRVTPVIFGKRQSLVHRAIGPVLR